MLINKNCRELIKKVKLMSKYRMNYFRGDFDNADVVNEYSAIILVLM